MTAKIIRIIQGDIAESTADAIVNAANSHLWMRSGVAIRMSPAKCGTPS